MRRGLAVARSPVGVVWLIVAGPVLGAGEGYSVRQITSGPQHHFFGYIGHAGTVPWNASGRYIVALRTRFIDKFPEPDDVADIILLDAHRNYAARVVDQTRAWNPQQGTMLYWNPQAADTQFFFNDRDPVTGKVFAVLFDVALGKRVREFRYGETPVGNSGVAQRGGYLLGINYGRLARLRPVTGYAEAWDWTTGFAAPTDDGIFVIDVATGDKRLLVSYAALRAELVAILPHAKDTHLFINHTLWNRDDDRIYFYVRGNFRSPLPKVDVPFTTDLQGNLQRQMHLGGHPEWELGRTMIGSHDGRQVLYDTDRQEITGQLGSSGDFSRPGGDIALSPDGKRFVNGYSSKDPAENYYSILFRRQNRLVHTRGFSRGQWTAGQLRIDPAPCWNRTGEQLLISAITDDAKQTRQLFVIHLQQ